MRIMCVVDIMGNRRNAVAQTKKALDIWLAKLKLNSVEIVAWRYHDGSGWADGSPDAWQHISGVVGEKAEIVI